MPSSMQALEPCCAAQRTRWVLDGKGPNGDRIVVVYVVETIRSISNGTRDSQRTLQQAYAVMLVGNVQPKHFAAMSLCFWKNVV